MPNIKNYKAYMQKLLLTAKLESIPHNQKLILEAIMDLLQSCSQIESDLSILKKRTSWLGKAKEYEEKEKLPSVNLPSKMERQLPFEDRVEIISKRAKGEKVDIQGSIDGIEPI